VRFLWAFLLFLSVSLHATQVVTQTVYENPDHIDLMLTFDTPWSGKIARTKKGDTTVLILDKVTFPKKEWHQKSNSGIVDSVTLDALNDKTAVTLAAPSPVQIDASKTIDKSGLRIRIHKAPASTLHEEVHPIPAPADAATPKDTYSFSAAFLKIMLVLSGLIALLWFLKKWMEKKSGGNWLFGKNDETSQIKVISQKPLDMKNRVVLLRYEEREYLVLLGENNLLLDRFEEGEEAAFEKLLQKRGKKLGEYLED